MQNQSVNLLAVRLFKGNEPYKPVVISMYKYFRFIDTYSICVCSDIEIWASGCLPEVRNNRKIQVPALKEVAVAYEEFQIQ